MSETEMGPEELPEQTDNSARPEDPPQDDVPQEPGSAIDEDENYHPGGGQQ